MAVTTRTHAAVAVDRQRSGYVVRLTGTIDADTNFAPFSLLEGAVIFDLDAVDRVTSFGVREWIRALASCPAAYYAFVNCRPSFLVQFNTVSGFAGRGELISFYLPYLCDACDHEFEILLDLRERYSFLQNGSVPNEDCPQCGEGAEFDEVETSYFAYAAARPPPAPPQEALRLLSDDSGAPVDFNVRKEIVGEVTAIWLSGQIDQKARARRAFDGLEGNVVSLWRAVEGIAEGSGRRLQQLLESLKQVNAWAARVPAPLLATLVECDREALAGRLLSITVTSRCAACGSSGAADLVAPFTAETVVCPFCAVEGAVVEADSSALALAKELAAEAMPPVIERYLAARTGDAPPVPDRDGSNSTGSGFGRFEPLRELGKGGMALVYLARQRGPSGFTKRLALKTLLPEVARDERFREMFLREARLAAHISHPNVVQIYDLGHDGGRYFIAMEYVKGWNLNTVLRCCTKLENRMPLESACFVARELCAGLHAAHVCVDETGAPLGIVHRDVSPHNVLLSDDGAVKITDFGVARADDSGDTATGELKGKVVYMAPEQIDPARGPVDAQSDVFAAGLIFFEMLTGQQLFRRDNPYSSMNAVLVAPIPSVRDIRPDVPAEIEEVLRPALSRDRKDRYATARDFQLAIDAATTKARLSLAGTSLATWLSDLVTVAVEQGELSSPQMTPTSVSSNRLAAFRTAATATIERSDGPTVIMQEALPAKKKSGEDV